MSHLIDLALDTLPLVRTACALAAAATRILLARLDATPTRPGVETREDDTTPAMPASTPPGVARPARDIAHHPRRCGRHDGAVMAARGRSAVELPWLTRIVCTLLGRTATRPTPRVALMPSGCW